MDAGRRSLLRGTADPARRSPNQVLSPGSPLSEDAGQWQGFLQGAAAPLDGSPTCAWLDEVLTAERDAVTSLLRARHEMLLADLMKKEASLPATLGKVKPGLAEDRVSTQGSSRARSRSPPVSRPPLPPLPATLEDAEHPFAVLAVAEPTTADAVLAVADSWSDSLECFEATDDPPEPDKSAASLMKGARDSELTHKSGGSEAAKQTPTGLWSRISRGEESQISHRGSQATIKRKLSFLQEPEDEGGILGRVVESPIFELAIASVIMANAIVMAFQTQYQGMDLGLTLRYGRYDAPAKESWPGFELAITSLDWVFGVVFTAELVVKVLGYRVRWFLDLWNYFDAAIVCLWLIETPLSSFALNLPTNAAILRTARLFRLLRLLRVIRMLQGFDSLYLLMTTLKGSLWVLGWSCVLLLTVQMLIAFVFFFILTEVYFDNDNYPEKERREVFEYFGTFTRAMLTMFEMTLANWPPVVRLLVENVSEWFTPFCVFHKLTIGFAVIGVINGVFMQETFKVAATDDRIMVRQREREIMIHTQKMTRLFKAADSSGDGEIDIEEFKQVMEDPEILMWLASMEITVRDPESLYRLLDSDGDGGLTAEELVKGALKMRGNAKSVDVLSMRRDVADIKAALVDMSVNVAKMKERPELRKLPTNVFSEEVNFFDDGAKARESISRSNERKATGASSGDTGSKPITRSEVRKLTGRIVDQMAQPYTAQVLSLKSQPLAFT